MIGRACAAGVPFGWFAGDEVYGNNGKLRTRLETSQIRYAPGPPGTGGSPWPCSPPPSWPSPPQPNADGTRTQTG
jgi:SRSO17 transposase